MLNWSRFMVQRPKANAAIAPPNVLARSSIVSKAIPIQSTCGAPKSEYQDGQPPHDEAHERFLEEGRESRAHDGDLLHALQFRPHPPNHESYPGNGSGRHVEALGNV